jgi:hypothetical protein
VESALEGVGEDWGAYAGLPPRVELLDDGRGAHLLAPLSYRRPDGSDWPVPTGAWLDGASIPRPLWSLIGGPFEGRYRNASIVHDHYCITKTRPWQDVHRMFYEAMRCSGTGATQAKIMYYSVYRFGPRWPSLEEGLEAAPPAAFLSDAEAPSLAADAEAIHVQDLDLDEIEALADARNADSVTSALEGTGGSRRRTARGFSSSPAAARPRRISRRWRATRPCCRPSCPAVREEEDPHHRLPRQRHRLSRRSCAASPRAAGRPARPGTMCPGAYFPDKKRVVIATDRQRRLARGADQGLRAARIGQSHRP